MRRFLSGLSHLPVLRANPKSRFWQNPCDSPIRRRLRSPDSSAPVGEHAAERGAGKPVSLSPGAGLGGGRVRAGLRLLSAAGGRLLAGKDGCLASVAGRGPGSSGSAERIAG